MAQFKVVGSKRPEPARFLGKEGQRLWDDVVCDYPIDNPAAAEILLLAAETSDRNVALRAEREVAAAAGDERALSRISRELTACVALVASLLHKLDRYVVRKPARGPGRPPSNIHWTPEE